MSAGLSTKGDGSYAGSLLTVGTQRFNGPVPPGTQIIRKAKVNPLATRLLHRVTEFLEANPKNGIRYNTAVSGHLVSFTNVRCAGNLSFDDFTKKVEELVTNIVRSSRLSRRFLEARITAEDSSNKAPVTTGLSMRTKARNLLQAVK